MSKVEWTNEQLQAINEKDSNILVAAAAGSGKTAVLVERIIHKIIDEKMDINKILVVTFTNAAASEMRERILEAIYQKLEKNPQDIHLQRQITLLNKASICTIHSFCLEVIHNHFYEIDMPSNFRISDTAEIALLKQDVLDDLFEQKYEEGNEDFLELLKTYTNYRGDEALQELVLSIHEFIQSSPFPEKWLQEKINIFQTNSEIEDFGKSAWGTTLLQYIQEKVEEAILQLKTIKNTMSKYIELAKFTNTIIEDIDKLENILSTIDSWENTYQKVASLNFGKWPIDKKVTIDIKEEAKEIRDKVKKTLKNDVQSVICRSSESVSKDFKVMLPVLQKLSHLVLEFSENFANRKKEKNCIDFNDIEHFALKILINENGEPTEVAKKYQEKFLEIAIDEYQDSNLVQEAILTSISKGHNIFMVGDVKQSIYRFRQARPELFLHKYETYKIKENKNQDDDLKVQLFRNFRSRENILNFTNLVFETIMTKELGDISYNENEYLNYGANYPKPEDRTEPHQKSLQEASDLENENTLEQNQPNYAGMAEMLLIDLKEDESITAFKEQSTDLTMKNTSDDTISETENDDEELERVEDEVLEARFVANKIQELLHSNYMVYDKKKGYRKVQPKDIVILLRATSALAPIYEKELADIDLPVFSDSSSSYLESVEIETILSLLKILDNPLQDIPLVVVLRSAIANFTDNDLITIRLTDRNCQFYEALLKARISCEEPLKNKIEAFIQKLEKWKSQEGYLALDELIWQIYLDTGYYQYVGLLPNGAMRQANLKSLFEKAKQYETASYKGLFNFIHFIEKLKKQKGDFAQAKLIGENEDVIRIMSIHKSKGLEFPVVFLCGTHKKFNLQDLNDVILLHQDMGFGPTLINTQKKLKYNTLAKEAIKLKMKQETLAEEERVLYVALTRAKEKLFITGRSKDLEKDLKRKEQQLGPYLKPEENSLKLDYKLIKKGNSYLDWILMTYLSCKNKKILLKGKEFSLNQIVNLQSYPKKELLKTLKKQEEIERIDIREEIQKQLNSQSGEETEDIMQELQKTLNWQYEYLVDTKLPTKTSVTQIKQEKMKLEEMKTLISENNLKNVENIEQSESIFDKQQTHANQAQEKIEQQENMFLDQKINDNKNEELKQSQEKSFAEIVPKFLKEQETISNAKKGTLIHLCIQRIDEKQDYTLNDIKQMVQELVQKEIITKQEADAIDINLLYKYTQSELFQELRKAKEVHKEQPFYINMPAKEIIQEAKEANSGKNILVQGIIDLYYINQNDELILVDLKTDYVENTPDAKEKILEKYKVQLEIYQTALEQALGKKVTKAGIYMCTWGTFVIGKKCPIGTHV